MSREDLEAGRELEKEIKLLTDEASSSLRWLPTLTYRPQPVTTFSRETRNGREQIVHKKEIAKDLCDK